MEEQATVTYRFEPADHCVMCSSRDLERLGLRLDRSQGLRPRRQLGVATTVVRCRRCGLIFASPRPVPEHVAQHYDRPPEAYWEPEYFSENPRYFADAIASFRRLWSGDGTPRALDIGAGLGKAMSALGRGGFDVHGIEPSAAFRDQAIANGISPDRLRLGAVEEQTYDEGSFDLISFAAVLEHLHDPPAVLEHALKWLAPDGLIYVEVPSAKWLLSRAVNLAHRVRRLDYVTNLSPMHPPFHLYEFTAEAFDHLGERLGYRIVERHFFVAQTFLPKPVGALADRLMRATDTGMQLEVWLAAGAPTPAR